MKQKGSCFFSEMYWKIAPQLAGGSASEKARSLCQVTCFQLVMRIKSPVNELRLKNPC